MAWDEGLRSITIMRTTPDAEINELQDRMPVILNQADWPVWLGEPETDLSEVVARDADGG